MARNARILALVLALSPAAQPQQRLDLGKLETRSGPQLTGGKGNSAIKLVQLPLELTIDRVWPLSITWQDKIELDVTIRNIGKETLSIPASKNFLDVYRAGNADVKSMSITLRMQTVEPAVSAVPVDNDFLDFAISSASVPGSFLLLPPNGTLSIHVAAELPEAVKTWRDLGVVKVRAQAIYQESYIDASDLKSWNSSNQVVSGNSAEFTLALPRRR